jgi:hypothetical protein
LLKKLVKQCKRYQSVYLLCNIKYTTIKIGGESAMDIGSLKIECTGLVKELASVPRSKMTNRDVYEMTNAINSINDIDGLLAAKAQLMEDIDEAVKSNQMLSELEKRQAAEELERMKEAEEQRLIDAQNPNAAKFL